MPAKQQTTSQLLLLPAELRIRILRMLMKEAEVLTPFQRLLGEEDVLCMDDETMNQRRASYLEKLQFSAQLLRCCQQLYHEGIHILYGENQVEIAFTVDDEWQYGIDILAGRVQIISTGSCWDPLDLDMEETAWEQITVLEDGSLLDDGDMLRCTAQDLQYITNYYTALLRFKHIRMTFEEYLCQYITLQLSQNQVFQTARLLAPLVRNKVVLVTFRYSEVLQWIESFRIWKCQKIDFAGEVPAEAAKLTQCITSARSIRDTFPLWRKFRHDVLEEVHEYSDKYLSPDELVRTLTLFNTHIMSYEFDDAHTLGRKIIREMTAQRARTISDTTEEEDEETRLACERDENYAGALLMLWDHLKVAADDRVSEEL